MIWKLLHLYFGWDYIYWEHPDDHGISRIHFTEEGAPYWKYFGRIHVINEKSVLKYNIVFLTSSYEEHLGEDDGTVD